MFTMFDGYIIFSEYILIFNTYNVGPPFDSVQLPYKWLNSMVYDTYNSIHVFFLPNYN